MNNKGQTLLEVMLAIGIMVFGVISIISLSITSSVMARRTSKELVATQLAREGVEAVHNIRDSNWLAIDDGEAVSWNTNLYNTILPTDYTTVPVFNSTGAAGGVWSINNWAVNNPTKICLNSSHIYIQRLNNNPCPPGFTETPYRRLLTITPITDGLNVKCKVIWNDGGKDYSKIMEENIYDWKAR